MDAIFVLFFRLLILPSVSFLSHPLQRESRRPKGSQRGRERNEGARDTSVRVMLTVRSRKERGSSRAAEERTLGERRDTWIRR